MAGEYSGTQNAGNVSELTPALREVTSLDILHEAMGVLRYEEFAVQKTELGVAIGDSISIITYNNLPKGGKLTEGVPLQTKKMTSATQKILMEEWGNAVGLTERLLQLSWDDLLGEAAILLGRDFAEVRDLSLRDTIVNGGDILFPSAAYSSLSDITAADVMDVDGVRRCVELLETENAPRFYADFYICFIHPHQASSIKRDPEWVAAAQYAGSRQIYNGEIGRWDDVIFIQTTYQGQGKSTTGHGYDSTLDGTGDSGTDLYRATVVADQAYAVADALDVELRDGGVQDFGRLHSMAWYAIWGTKVLESAYIKHLITA